MTNNQAAASVEDPRLRPSSEWPRPHERTGARFVLTNVTDPSRADDYSAWYDDYERAIIRPGLVAKVFRFENPDAAGTETDPRYASSSANTSASNPLHRTGRRGDRTSGGRWRRRV
jgi:hypothetical protein